MGLQKIPAPKISGTGWTAQRNAGAVILTFDEWDGTGFTLPEGWRPTIRIRGTAAQGGWPNRIRLVVTPTGAVQALEVNGTTGVLIYGQVTYTT